MASTADDRPYSWTDGLAVRAIDHSLTIEAWDYDVLASDVFDDGIDEPTKVIYTISFDAHGDVSSVTCDRMGEVGEKGTWLGAETETFGVLDLPIEIQEHIPVVVDHP